jgi:azurin
MKSRILALLFFTALPAFAKDVQVSIKAVDRMKFDVMRFEAGSGDTVEIAFENTGRQPKERSGYNLVILNKGTDVNAFAREALKARASDFIPPQRKADILAHTRLLGPGEKDSLRFTAPEPGEYPYLCSFPGHHTLMKGVFVVK